MTAQTPDIMILNGKALELHTTPLEGHLRIAKAVRPNTK
jgi:hypothetical protein